MAKSVEQLYMTDCNAGH